ncbi:MAG: Flp pilus assembly complex ATPase component TadA [Brockia lithotrophica]|nr:Flp pilus assembly complex ATPase component TadA [Brockia lithotrophica]
MFSKPQKREVSSSERKEILEKLRKDPKYEELKTYVSNVFQKAIQEGEDLEETKIKILAYLTDRAGVLSRFARVLVEEVYRTLMGYGPIQQLIDDPLVTDVWIVKPDYIVYEKQGKIYVFDDDRFESADHLENFIIRLAQRSGANVSYRTPITSFTTPEGFRVAVQIRPIAKFPFLSLRKFVDVPTLDVYVTKYRSFDRRVAEFLRWAVKARRNIIIAGGMGTGKTTLLASMAKEIPEHELPMLVEEVAEFPIDPKNLRRSVVRVGGIGGEGEVNLAMLLKNALQHKPTRVLVSEVRDGAIYYMLQAMLIGHEGGITTIHADSVESAFYNRMPAMLSQSEEMMRMEYDDKLFFLAEAIHLIVHLMQDPVTGKRYLNQIAEIIPGNPLQKERPRVNLLFQYDPQAGTAVWTGKKPERIFHGADRYGYKFPDAIFKKGAPIWE